jgi:hypothetical protein
LSQDNSKLPQRDFFGGWHLIIMVVMFLQIEITISFHKNQSSLDLMTYITVWVEVLFWSKFLFPTCFSACYYGEVSLEGFLFRFQIELGFLTIACSVSWPLGDRAPMLVPW